jgi:hypothetical protein
MFTIPHTLLKWLISYRHETEDNLRTAAIPLFYILQTKYLSQVAYLSKIYYRMLLLPTDGN